MKLKQALVTGGSGFLGTSICQLLIDTRWQVKNLDLNPSQHKEVFDYQGDIRRPELSLKATENVEIVFHNVAQLPLSKNPTQIYQVNVEGTKNLIEASIQNGVKRFVLTSSSAVFGIPESLPADKIKFPKPIETYGKTKLMAENLLQSYAGYFDSVSIIRPRTILGAGRLGLFSLLFDWINKGLMIPVFDGGYFPYQFVHIDDLAKGIVAASKIEGTSLFHLGANEFQALERDLMELIQKVGSQSQVVSLPSKTFRGFATALTRTKLIPFAEYQVLLYSRPMYFDAASDWNILGVENVRSNVETLLETYDWFLENAYSKDEFESSLHQLPLKGISSSLLTQLLEIATRVSRARSIKVKK